MEDSASVGNDLEMHPSGRNETPNAVFVDTSSIFRGVDDDELTSDVKEYPSNQGYTANPGAFINTFITI